MSKLSNMIVGGAIGVVVTSYYDKKKINDAYQKGYSAACEEMKNYAHSEEGEAYIKEIVNEILDVKNVSSGEQPAGNDNTSKSTADITDELISQTQELVKSAKKELAGLIETFTTHNSK